jgi:hypothetical protein
VLSTARNKLLVCLPRYKEDSNMPRLIRAFATALCLLLFSSGCQGSSSGTPTRIAPIVGCRYQFHASIENPSAGEFLLQGKLVLVQNALDNVSGVLIQDGRNNVFGRPQGIPTTVGIANGKISLTFDHNNGSIKAVGNMTAPVSACSGQLAGTVIGPHSDDAGTWVALADPQDLGGEDFDTSSATKQSCVKACTDAHSSQSLCSFACEGSK